MRTFIYFAVLTVGSLTGCRCINGHSTCEEGKSGVSIDTAEVLRDHILPPETFKTGDVRKKDGESICPKNSQISIY